MAASQHAVAASQHAVAASQHAVAASQHTMAASPSQQPVKGILKNKSSVACSLVPSAVQQQEKSAEDLHKKSQKWDEMNILATYYIGDEDLVQERVPSTPDNSIESNDEDAFGDSETNEALNPDMLAKKLAAAKGSKPKYLLHESSDDEDSDFSSGGKKSLLTTCCLFFFRCSVGNGQGGEKTQLQRISRATSEKQLEFEMKRKLYDSEGFHLKLARQLISKDEDDEEITTTTGENTNM